MKRTMFSLLAVVILVGLTGCVARHGRLPWACTGDSCVQTSEDCDECVDPGRCRACRGHGCGRCRGEEAINPGPSTGTVTYPYYTTRGPRDFLADNPPSIGP